MLTRIVVALAAVGALGGLLIYHQYRPIPDRVSGIIEADEIRLGSRVGGRVAKVHVEEGDRVKPGDVLIELEPYDLVDEQRRAQAALAGADAEYRRLKSGLRPEEVEQAKARYDQLQAKLDRLIAGPRKQEIDAARANLQVAEAQRRLAGESFARTQKLRETNAATAQELDRATEALEAAEGAVAARREELSLLEAGTRPEEIREVRAMVEEARLAAQLAEKGYRSEEVDAAAANRDSAQAALDAIKARIEELTVRSPIAGVVESLEIRKGDLAQAGSPVMSILDDGKLWVRAYVPEDRVDLRPDQPAWVTVDSRPGKRYKAAVTFIARQAEFTPSNVQTPEERVKQVFRIKATLAEGLDELRPGMPADVWLEE